MCKDFKKRIEEIINQYPTTIINFFTKPMKWLPTKIEYYSCYNQCTYFPKGISKKIHDTIEKFNFLGYSQEFMLRRSLYRMKTKVLTYRPCLVQHIDNGSLMGKYVSFCRRTPYFIDYLDELGITYDEAK